MADDTHTPLEESRTTGHLPPAEYQQTRNPDGDASKAIAFFDLDGTLVAGNTQALLVRFLRSAKIINRRFVAFAVLWFVRYKLGLVKVSEEERARSASMLAGLSTKEVDRAISQFVDDRLMPRLHPGALAALREHQDAGDRVVVLSAALDPVVRWLAARLEVSDSAGAPCEVAGGRYTGRLSGASPHGERKAQMALEFARSYGADVEQCWAYADHDSDVALLRAVGHAVAVHPKPGLAKLARASGWPILP